MSEQFANIQFNDNQLEAPVKKATLGSNAFDVAKVQADIGLYTFNDGLGATASCESAITFINGGEGKLFYRGYPIDQLANKANFTQVIYLLCHGELPTQEQHTRLQTLLKDQAALPQAVIDTVLALPANSHPMSMVMTAIAALSGLEFNPFDPYNKDMREAAVISLLAKIPTIAALGLSSQYW